MLCLTVPEYVSIKEQILSLAKSIAHSLHMPHVLDKIINRSDIDPSEKLSVRVWIDFAARIVNTATGHKISLLIIDTN